MPRERAIIARTSLGNIVTEPGREDALKERQGLPLAAMDEGSAQPRARAARRLRQEPPPRPRRGRARPHPPGGHRAIHFAWGGPLEDGHANYWRLHGPVSLIEYDNTQNDANHIHSVWHDLERNFGRDLLREHYESRPTTTPTAEAPGLGCGGERAGAAPLGEHDAGLEEGFLGEVVEREDGLEAVVPAARRCGRGSSRGGAR